MHGYSDLSESLTELANLLRVYDAHDPKDVGLTREPDKIFLLENEFYAHSVNKSHRGPRNTHLCLFIRLIVAERETPLFRVLGLPQGYEWEIVF